MKIVINGKFLTQPKTGVQRYAIELLDQFNALLEDDPCFNNVELSVYTPPLLATPPRWKKIHIRSFGSSNHQYWEQIQLPRALSGQLLFSPANIGPVLYKKQVITLHDASVYAVPEAYTLPFRLKYYLLLPALAKRALGFITDSKFSQAEIVKYLAIRPSRISVIPLGGDHLAKIDPDPSTMTRLELPPREYYLLVGSRSRHKNTEMVYDALEQWGYKGTLVHIGGSFNQIFETRRDHLPPFRVVDPGFIGDDILKALYQNAKAFIFPSMYEGFGFPPLEAMNEGCPVICSNAASLPEVVGSAAYTFDPNSKNDLIDQLKKLEGAKKKRAQRSMMGIEHARQYSWRTTAQSTLDELIVKASTL